MEKKYELIGETIDYDGRTLHRIKAIKNFNNVKEGDLGGWIEKEENLSQEGNCWIYSQAKVYDDASVYGHAIVCGHAKVYGQAIVYGHAKVFGHAKVYGQAIVYGHAKVFDDAKVYGQAKVYGHAKVFDNTGVYGQAKINKSISSNDNYITVGPIGSRYDTTTFINTDMEIHVNCGCFSGTLDQFKDRVLETHGDNKHAKDYLAVIEFVKIKFNL